VGVSVFSGRVRSALIIGGQGIRARKLRTLLSMVSLFLGVLAVVVVQAGADILERTALADIDLTQGKDGTRYAYLPGDATTIPMALEVTRGRSDAVASISTTAIIGEPGVRPINPGAQPFEDLAGGAGQGGVVCFEGGCVGPDDPRSGQPTQPDGQAIEVSLTALTGDVRVFQPFRFRSGQWLDFSGTPSLAPRIVLNEKAAVGFSRYHVPAEMRVNGATANMTPQIIGVVDDGGYQPAAYVRADELLNWVPESKLVDSGMGGVKIMTSPEATDVEQTLRKKFAAAGVREEMGRFHTVDSRERTQEQLAIMRWIFLGIAGLVLLIGVAGILNVGLATVGERVEEFALRRAVGTSRLLLAGIVLAETLLTGLITATAAIGLTAAGVEIGRRLLAASYPVAAEVSFPMGAGVAGVLAGLIAGLLGGLIPAVRAARIPIATVMRA
jgi:putative ABC transport system permease protein